MGRHDQSLSKPPKSGARIYGAEIVEGNAEKDHIHLCLSIPPKYSVPGIIGFLKGMSASEVMNFGQKSKVGRRPIDFTGAWRSPVATGEHNSIR
jgi:REP element-mobilizing transposase RayT